MTKGGTVREGLPVPAIARAHVGVHTADPPSPSLASPGRIGDAACWQHCPKCGRETLLARSAGILTRVNAEPVSLTAEIAARIRGRHTYDILCYGIPRHIYLEYRDLLRVRATRKYTVVAEHHCDELVLLSGPVSNEVREIVIPYGNPLPDIPPF